MPFKIVSRSLETWDLSLTVLDLEIVIFEPNTEILS